MKRQVKFFALAASAVMALSACTADKLEAYAGQPDTNPESPSNAISFGTYMGRVNLTRAAYAGGTITNEATGDNSLHNAEFGVFAKYTGTTDYNIASPATEPNFMYDQEITWNSTMTPKSWVYTPVKYWPNGIDADNLGGDPSNTATQAEDGKLSFFAFAPYTAKFSTAYAAATDGVKPTAIASDDYVKRATTITPGTTKGVVAMTTNNFTGNVWVKYLMPSANESEAVDLLWGTNGKTTYDEADGTDPALGAIGTSYNINLTKQTAGEKINFLFKHALSKIGGNTASASPSADNPATKCGFMVVVDVDANNGDNQHTYFSSNFNPAQTLVTIEKVEIMDTESAHDAGINTGGSTTSDFNSFGWFNIETGEWCSDDGTYGVSGGGATYSVTADKNETTIDADAVYVINKAIREIGVKNATGVNWNASASSETDGYTGGASGVTTTPQPLFADENVPGLVVIPGGANNNTLYVRTTYRVRTADANLATGFTNVAQTITNRVILGNALDPNHYYTIIMHLGLTSIKFEAKVADWQRYDDSDIAEDGQEIGGTVDNEESIWLPSNVVTANAWSVTSDIATIKAMGTDAHKMTLTVTMNSGARAYDASTPTHEKYTITKNPADTWLTVNADGTLQATANTGAKRTATIMINTKATENGVVLSTPFVVTQEAYTIVLTPVPSTNTITVKDGDGQNESDYVVSVTGGDGNGTKSVTGGTVTVGGTLGQTYTITISKNGVTKSINHTVITAP